MTVAFPSANALTNILIKKKVITNINILFLLFSLIPFSLSLFFLFSFFLHLLSLSLSLSLSPFSIFFLPHPDSLSFLSFLILSSLSLTPLSLFPVGLLSLRQMKEVGLLFMGNSSSSGGLRSNFGLKVMWWVVASDCGSGLGGSIWVFSWCIFIWVCV